MTIHTSDSELHDALRARLPAARVITDPLRRLAYGTDASFYRLVPRAVVVAESDDDVRAVVALTPLDRILLEKDGKVRPHREAGGGDEGGRNLGLAARAQRSALAHRDA